MKYLLYKGWGEKVRLYVSITIASFAAALQLAGIASLQHACPEHINTGR